MKTISPSPLAGKRQFGWTVRITFRQLFSPHLYASLYPSPILGKSRKEPSATARPDIFRTRVSYGQFRCLSGFRALEDKIQISVFRLVPHLESTFPHTCAETASESSDSHRIREERDWVRPSKLPISAVHPEDVAFHALPVWNWVSDIPLSPRQERHARQPSLRT